MKIRHWVAAVATASLGLLGMTANAAEATTPDVSLYHVSLKLVNGQVIGSDGSFYYSAVAQGAGINNVQWYVYDTYTDTYSNYGDYSGINSPHFYAPDNGDGYEVYACAYDSSGNQACKYSDTFYPYTLDDTDFSHSAGWKETFNATPYNNTTLTSKRVGSTATDTFYYHNLGLVFDVGPNSGYVQVSVDGGRYKSINLHSVATQARVVAFTTGQTTSRSHSVVVRVQSGTVNLDAAILLE